MLLGDIHNSRQVLDAALRTAADESCDVLVQVGDFGLQDCTWAGFAPAQAGLMLSALDAAIPVVVIDGNHEMWPCLSRFVERDDTAAARRAGRPLHLGGSLWWAHRGSTWMWSGARFGALGGSTSPDRWMPHVARHRWKQETTTQQDLDQLLQTPPTAWRCSSATTRPRAPQDSSAGCPGRCQPVCNARPTRCSSCCRQPWTPPNPHWCSTGTGTNRTDAASPTAARLSGSPATDTPRARLCCRSATCKPATWTRYSVRTTGASPTGDATTGGLGAIADQTRPRRELQACWCSICSLNLPGFHAGCLV